MGQLSTSPTGPSLERAASVATLAPGKAVVGDELSFKLIPADIQTSSQRVSMWELGGCEAAGPVGLTGFLGAPVAVNGIPPGADFRARAGRLQRGG